MSVLLGAGLCALCAHRRRRWRRSIAHRAPARLERQRECAPSNQCIFANNNCDLIDHC